MMRPLYCLLRISPRRVAVLGPHLPDGGRAAEVLEVPKGPARASLVFAGDVEVLASPVFSLLELHCTVGRTKEKRIATELRVNDRIRVPKVRVVASDGSQVGIIDTQKALDMAAEQDLDLVEVAAQADPPVCRIMDYGKYKYEQDQRQKEARKKQSLIIVKEMKMRPKIDKHDYETKKGHVVRFLRQGAKVKVTIMFRGREMAHQELGRRLLDQLAADVAEIAKVDTPPKVDGRNMTMVLGPYKEAVTHRPPPAPKHKGEKPAEPAEPRAEAAAPPRKLPPKITRAEGG
ncbi:MAG: translation initiation factor IF-3 [Actinomycetota bacterium]